MGKRGIIINQRGVDVRVDEQDVASILESQIAYHEAMAERCRRALKNLNGHCPHCDGTGVEPVDPREDPTDPGVTISVCSACNGGQNA